MSTGQRPKLRSLLVTYSFEDHDDYGLRAVVPRAVPLDPPFNPSTLLYKVQVDTLAAIQSGIAFYRFLQKWRKLNLMHRTHHITKSKSQAIQDSNLVQPLRKIFFYKV